MRYSTPDEVALFKHRGRAFAHQIHITRVAHIASPQARVILSYMKLCPNMNGTAWRWHVKKKTAWLRIFYDVESSGRGTVDDPRERITAFGAAVLVSGRRDGVDRRFYRLVNPGHMQTSYTQALTGLADEDLERAPVFADVWSDFARFTRAHLKRHNVTEGLVLVGHNINTSDNYKLFSELRRSNRQLVDLLLPRLQLRFEDTLPRRKLHKDEVRLALGVADLKLSTLHRHYYGAAAEDKPHDALWDATAVRDIYTKSTELRMHATSVRVDEAFACWRRLKGAPRDDWRPL